MPLSGEIETVRAEHVWRANDKGARSREEIADLHGK